MYKCISRQSANRGMSSLTQQRHLGRLLDHRCISGWQPASRPAAGGGRQAAEGRRWPVGGPGGRLGGIQPDRVREQTLFKVVVNDMYMNMHIYMFISQVYIYIYIYIFIYIYAYYIHLYVRTYIYVCIYVYICNICI